VIAAIVPDFAFVDLHEPAGVLRKITQMPQAPGNAAFARRGDHLRQRMTVLFVSMPFIV